MKRAILDQVNSGLLHNYVFPSEERAALAEQLIELAPEGLEKVFLLTTGSEATECALKLARSHGIRKGGTKKIGIVGAERGFHGRTLGAQQAGGIPGQKGWIVNEDPAIVQIPFPLTIICRIDGLSICVARVRAAAMCQVAAKHK